jgi:hypothetical protein
MNTPITRKHFLTTLAGLIAVPFVASRALGAAKAPKAPNTLLTSTPLRITILPVREYDENGNRLIKVPSNRYLVEDRESICRDGYHPGHNVYHAYHGDWDGTFKLEQGCTNPAWVLNDLVRGNDGRIPEGVQPSEFNPFALYDWGVACDQPGDRHSTVITFDGTVAKTPYMPSLSVDSSLYTVGRETELRDRLRMFFLAWKSTDPRYRTSWPGIPYPGDSA